MTCRCPDCSAALARIERKLDRLLAEPTIAQVTAMPSPAPEAWLEPCVIGGRLGLSEGHVRRLCQRGLQRGDGGVQKNGGRWLATVEAIAALRDS